MVASRDSWSAWKGYEDKSTICYVFSDASSKKPEHLDHGRVSLFVRRLKSGQTRTEASLQAGYRFAPAAIRIAVDGKSFTMIPRGNYAWLRRAEREAEFAHALEKGRVATVEATSRRGNRTTYTFSLKGFTAAMKSTRKGCR
ncbi:invasion associated locus B family protein [Microvirga splendida]|uniref:Invasion associated locus B family protein n=1 Tax=Microvirga splendida TaxID=2795727 RepID=A0ABS0XW98_9HYPH|nr:invasion associated locus B family protein [Microvirga splendida]MBJ6124311.1 invasion associated locus B family protein [Microvirga splendida]